MRRFSVICPYIICFASIASFHLALDRDFKDKSTGEKKADFINIIAWRQTGELVSRFFIKGRMAIVEGKLQLPDYTDWDGNKRTIAEMVADSVYFGDSKQSGGSPAAFSSSTAEQYTAGATI